MTLIAYDIPPGTPERQCLSCEQPIYWIRTENDRPMCLNPDGQRTATLARFLERAAAEERRSGSTPR